MSKPEVGDIIICNDVIGMIIGSTTNNYKVKLDDNKIIELYKKADIHIVASAYSVAALIYNKLISSLGR